MTRLNWPELTLPPINLLNAPRQALPKETRGKEGMLYAVNTHTKMHRPINLVSEASREMESVRKADQHGWINCGENDGNPLPPGIEVEVRGKELPATVPSAGESHNVFVGPSEKTAWPGVSHYRVPGAALTHEYPMAAEYTQERHDMASGPDKAVDKSMPKFRMPGGTPEPSLLNELVAAHDNLLDAQAAYDNALEDVRKAYPQLTIHANDANAPGDE